MERPLRRPVRRWENNIRMNLRATVWDSMDCVRLARDRDQWQPVVLCTQSSNSGFHKRPGIS
jgi:hypothetical protein